MSLIRVLTLSFMLLAVAACQTVSTAGNYRPANCGMVGSTCEFEKFP
jgi:hypothetical protein